MIVREDGKVLTPRKGWSEGCSAGKDGYMEVRVRSKTLLVHRLVAETFIPNPEDKPTVDHINRVRDDNRVKNLRWATHREQMDNSTHVLKSMDLGVRACDNPKEWARLYYAEKKNDPEWVSHRYGQRRAFLKTEEGRAIAREYTRRYRERKKARSEEQAS